MATVEIFRVKLVALCPVKAHLKKVVVFQSNPRIQVKGLESATPIGTVVPTGTLRLP
jgi:hypothetical protein